MRMLSLGHKNVLAYIETGVKLRKKLLIRSCNTNSLFSWELSRWEGFVVELQLEIPTCAKSTYM